MTKVVTRFPPSPTGYFHIGSARTALFNYLFAAHHGGSMYLRFEDTDKERSKEEYERDILEGLDWLGIRYTAAEPIRQSARADVHRDYLHRLFERGAAYEAEPSQKEGRVVRFKNPNVRVSFHDLIRGEVVFDTTELKDFVIARNVDDPLYHMAVVADDHDLGVTHIIRGEDHLSNTQRQILILEALGFERPAYAHIPLILAPDRSKLSKRSGATSVTQYKHEGFTAEALRTYLAFLGWTIPTGNEFPSLQEMIDNFRIEDVHMSGAVFDTEKLRWYNRHYLLELSDGEFGEELLPVLERELRERSLAWDAAIGAALVPVMRERISIWNDVRTMARAGELDFFFAPPLIDRGKVPAKGSDAATARRHLQAVRALLAALPERPFSQDDTKNAVWEYATKEGRGTVLWPLRYALSGLERSPDPFLIASILGKRETLHRIDSVANSLHIV